MTEQIEIVPEFGDVRAEEELDWNKLANYLRDKIPGVDAPMTVQQFRGGSSNLTYLLRFGAQEWVMRRPPFGPLPVGGHDMGREYRVLSRLWEVFKPAPRGMLYSDDTSIIGAPFFVMERRNGIVIKNRQPLPSELPSDPASYRAISEGFIDTLADLHNVDYEAIGLGSLGKPDGFLKRQITGWMARWEKAKTREVPLMEKLGAWFLENMPASPPPALIHNDFYLHNIMLGADNPGDVVGVFDWEMCTIGDPLVDLGSGGTAGDIAGRGAHVAARIPESGRIDASLRQPHRPRCQHDPVLLGMGPLEDSYRRRADLRAVQAGPNHRSAVRHYGADGASFGARRSQSGLSYRV
jgi:aminoglycoside phosphotransferase (APT) family kinase protein